MNPDQSIVGVVLCGGESKRMGSDKGLLPIHNTRWANYIADMLQALQIPVLVSINLSQRDSYRNLFRPEQLIIDNMAVAGPLKGILSVHEQYPENDLLIMACDMVDMEAPTLCSLMKLYQANPSFNYYIYQHGSFAEPFPGIYTSTGLKKVMGKVVSQALHNTSLKSILQGSDSMGILIKDKTSFGNYNSL